MNTNIQWRVLQRLTHTPNPTYWLPRSKRDSLLLTRVGNYLTLNFSFHYIFHINFGWSHSDYSANSTAAAAVVATATAIVVAPTGTEHTVCECFAECMCCVFCLPYVRSNQKFSHIQTLPAYTSIQLHCVCTWCAFVCRFSNPPHAMCAHTQQYKKAFAFMHVTVIDVSACVFSTILISFCFVT